MWRASHSCPCDVVAVLTVALTLIKGSCLPYRLVNMRSWSLRPPNTVLSGLASGFGASAGAALKARRSLQITAARQKEALAARVYANNAMHSTCWPLHRKLGQPAAETRPFSSPLSTSRATDVNTELASKWADCTGYFRRLV